MALAHAQAYDGEQLITGTAVDVTKADETIGLLYGSTDSVATTSASIEYAERNSGLIARNLHLSLERYEKVGRHLTALIIEVEKDIGRLTNAKQHAGELTDNQNVYQQIGERFLAEVTEIISQAEQKVGTL